MLGQRSRVGSDRLGRERGREKRREQKLGHQPPQEMGKRKLGRQKENQGKARQAEHWDSKELGHPAVEMKKDEPQDQSAERHKCWGCRDGHK